MRSLLLLLALFLGAIPMVSAQQTGTEKEHTVEDYETLIENHMKVKFRELAYKTLELTEDEIVKFDPLYSQYTEEKMKIVEKRSRLIENYKEEMKEDDDAKEKDEETAGFIENYWETQIKEMELQKDFFDRFEEVVSTDKAISFFLLEDRVQNRVEEGAVLRIIPMSIEVREYFYPNGDTMKDKKDTSKDWDAKSKDHKMSDTSVTTDANKKDWANKTDQEKKDWSNEAMTDKDKEKKDWTDKNKTAKTTTTTTTTKGVKSTSKVTAVNDYSTWTDQDRSKVALNHQYTHDGLQKLVAAVWAVADEHDVDVTAWSSKKEKVMSISNELQKDPKSTDHADITREAFVMIADMVNSIQTAKGTDATKKVVNSLSEAAKAINPDKLMTKQAKEIYSFFGHANKALHALSGTENWESISASSNYNK